MEVILGNTTMTIKARDEETLMAIKEARSILKDFTCYSKINKHYKELAAQLENCHSVRQVDMVMRNIRQQYM